MLKPVTLALVWLLVLAGQAAWADTCSPQNLRCLQSQTITVGGVVLENVCVRYERTEDCIRSNPVNECNPLLAHSVTGTDPLEDGQCRMESQTCLRSVAGVCDKYQRTYTCWNGPANAAPATLIERTFHNLTETFPDNCSPLEGDANCTLEETVTTQGFATRNINEQDITRAWWAKERRYDCTDNRFQEDCQPLEDAPICTQTGDELCLSWAADGSCEYVEYTYICQSDASFEASCEGINVCVGDNCTGVEQEVSEDFPKASAWLNFLDDLSDQNQCEAGDTTGLNEGDVVSAEDCETGVLDNGQSEPEVFAGAQGQCNIDAFINCCTNPYSTMCGQYNLDLKFQRDAGTTHLLGTRCTSRFLGICVGWTREYCVYNSKFARVFQEQANVQTGTQFAWQSDPECPALTIEQLETLNVDAMDLTEVFGDMLDQTTEPIEELVIDRIEGELGVYGPQVQETLE